MTFVTPPLESSLQSQFLNLSKLQLNFLSSYNTHSNQTTSIFNWFIKNLSSSHVNYIKMTSKASSTISWQQLIYDLEQHKAILFNRWVSFVPYGSTTPALICTSSYFCLIRCMNSTERRTVLVNESHVLIT